VCCCITSVLGIIIMSVFGALLRGDYQFLAKELPEDFEKAGKACYYAAMFYGFCIVASLGCWVRGTAEERKTGAVDYSSANAY